MVATRGAHIFDFLFRHSSNSCRLFFTQGENGKNLYGELALKQSAILNRPDNHIAALSSLDKKGVRDIESYFMEILPEFTNSLTA
jgi:hypothetical protein